MLVGTNTLDMYCFEVIPEGNKGDNWKLCHEDRTRARTARGAIILNVIKNYYVERGIYGNMNVLMAQSATNMDWSWEEQDQWIGVCKDGKSQSPIDISDKGTVLTDNMRIYLNWKSGAIPIARYNGRENVLEGDFGHIVHQLEIGARTFQANQIQFKFPSEHKIEGTAYDGEMLITHKADNGLQALVSVFLKEVTDGDGDHNIFVEGLDANGWTFDQTKSYRCDARPDPSQIVKGGVQYYFRKSFYWYMGSLSEPPCTQPVYRFVMKEAIKVPTTQFKTLREHTFDSSVSANIRRSRTGEGRMIYYHADNSVNCKLPSDKILTAAVDEIAKVQAMKPKQWSGKFIKAETKLNTYAVKIC